MQRGQSRTFFIAFLLMLSLAGQAAPAADRVTPVVRAIRKVSPAVVNIRTERIIQRQTSPFFGFADPFFENFFRELAPPRVYKTESLGSGVIIDAKGHVLTNSHVINKASKIFVALPGPGAVEKEAVLVGAAAHMDIAVLKLEGENFPHIKPATSADLMVGETVIAIGNPLGLGHSVTTGVVSAPRRRLAIGDETLSAFIQTDALINPGNSGGPLLNINGELIGINTAIIQKAQGIGFSIPIDTVRRILDHLIQFGDLQKGYTGLIVERIGRVIGNDPAVAGVLVSSVDDGSPAQKYGIAAGDVITEIDGVQITSPREFHAMLRQFVPDNTMRLGLRRANRKLSVDMELDRVPPDYGLLYASKKFGLRIGRISSGVRVEEVAEGSPAARRGIVKGDFIAEVQGRRVHDPEQFARVMEELMGRAPLEFLVVRGRQGYYLDLP